MEQQQNDSNNRRELWIRGLFMILLGVLYSIAGTVLFVVTVLQFAFTLFTDEPNQRLLSFGRSLGTYLQQVVYFQTFNSEDKPFPFSDWPV